ncbi:MAG: hypothetical protein ACETVY_00875 [Candidatus Bathyarchaeia archaeon]
MIRGKGVELIILLYFDWSGSRKELMEWNDKISEACEKGGVTYTGLYGSMNEKWNYVSVFETKSYDDFLSMGKHVTRPQYMTHYITEILMRQKL